MSNGKVIIVHLIAGLIKKTQSNKYNSIDCDPIVWKWASIFQNRMNHLVGMLTLKLTCLIMLQKEISKICRILILQVLH